MAKYLDDTALAELVSKIKVLVNTKQDTLTFDSAPTSSSTNPVTSGGVYTALNDYMPKAGGTFSSGLVVGSTASSVLELPNQAAIKAKVTNGSNTLSTIIKAGGQVVEFGSSSYLTRLYSKGRPQLYDYSQSPTFSGDIATLSDIPAAITSINGLSGGTLTSPLIVSGGDAATASKISLDQTASGQITNNGTQTLFGFTSNNATSLTVGHSSYALALRGSGTRPKFNGNDLALYSDLSGGSSTDVQVNGTSITSNGVANLVTNTAYNSSSNKIATMSDIPTVNNATLTIQLNGNNVQTFTANQSTNATANVQALPNYSLSIGSTNGGNPRQVLFCTVNYTNFGSESGAYFKLGAMSGHGNGVSYTFVEDIFINVSYTGTVSCQVYKYVQAAAGNVDSVARNYGDVFYVIDTTNKIVYFYILLGQYSSAQFTPGTKIGAARAVTAANGITQHTGTPTYYSSGTKVWATGDGATYVRSNDLATVATSGSYNDLSDKPTIPTDTGATSITTSGTGNAVTSASYNASTRQITLTKGSTFLKSAPVTSVAGLTGAITASNLLAQLVTLSLNGNNCVNGNYLKTLTSYARFVSNGSVKWGIEFGTYGNTSSDIQTANITFANSYSVPPTVIASMYWESGTREYTVRNLTTSGCKIYANGATRGFFYIAIGRLS